jgi:hypothetical protein
MYGPAVRCKRISSIWRMCGLHQCIRLLIGACCAPSYHDISAHAPEARSFVPTCACHVDPLNLVVVPDREAVTRDEEAEADKSNRPRRKRPQDDDDSYFRELAERPRIAEHLHEPCDDRVCLVTAARQHVIRAEHIEHLQDGSGDREERNSDIQHCAAPMLQVPNERSVAAPSEVSVSSVATVVVYCAASH